MGLQQSHILPCHKCMAGGVIIGCYIRFHCATLMVQREPRKNYSPAPASSKTGSWLGLCTRSYHVWEPHQLIGVPSQGSTHVGGGVHTMCSPIWEIQSAKRVPSQGGCMLSIQAGSPMQLRSLPASGAHGNLVRLLCAPETGHWPHIQLKLY